MLSCKIYRILDWKFFMNNALNFSGLPVFSQIAANNIEPAIRQLLDEHRATLEKVLMETTPTWNNTVAVLERMQHRLSRTWSPVGHLNNVMNNDELRAAYNACLPLLSAWYTDLGQNERLFRAYEYIQQHESSTLDESQQQVLNHALRDFKLAGVALPADQKARYKQLMETLTTLHSKFEENVLDSTNAWSLHIEDESRLKGIPAPIVARAKAAAAEKQLTGWWFSLDAPNYMSITMHADDDRLRREFYEAWVTRASDQFKINGVTDQQWDNAGLIEDIMRVRHEIAALVGFKSYAEYSLATKMAKSVDEVLTFLNELAARSKPAAKRELQELTEFSGRESLNAWDVGYYAERLKQKKFDLSEETLRPYFPVPRVLEGLFKVISTLYGVSIVERNDVDLYHPDVQFFGIFNADGSTRGGFYIDLYARPKKRGGAWMDDCIGRMQMQQHQSLPVAYMVCNFMPPDRAQGKPSLLTHSEVVTLFHEFGHGLHHMLTRVDIPSVAGIQGVPWDAVELPSQFMENFAWQADVLPWISRHIDTGEALPAVELQRLLGSRTFNAGLQTARQLEFAIFDLRLHGEYQPVAGARVAEILSQVREQVAVITPPAFNRFAQSFSHVFAGGYAAGYYSYKWAEVLAADAFSAFEEEGVFNHQTAARFANSILERGGSRDVMQAFVEFRGRKPDVKPLLRQLGLAA
jgi:oligopeptidase A